MNQKQERWRGIITDKEGNIIKYTSPRKNWRDAEKDVLRKKRSGEYTGVQRVDGIGTLITVDN